MSFCVVLWSLVFSLVWVWWVVNVRVLSCVRLFILVSALCHSLVETLAVCPSWCWLCCLFYEYLWIIGQELITAICRLVEQRRNGKYLKLYFLPVLYLYWCTSTTAVLVTLVCSRFSRGLLVGTDHFACTGFPPNLFIVQLFIYTACIYTGWLVRTERVTEY